MRRDPFGSGSFREQRQSHRIRLHKTTDRGVGLLVACLSHRRAVIDIYSEKNHVAEV